MDDFYAMLGVDADASESTIKAAYRRKASQYHPDRNSALDAPLRFREIQVAYETLSDGEKRRSYDENRRRSLLENPLETATQLWQAYITRVLN